MYCSSSCKPLAKKRVLEELGVLKKEIGPGAVLARAACGDGSWETATD